jgi:hypothetical protein
MKTATILLIITFLLLIFTVGYTLFLYKMNYGAMDYDEYQKGQCELKELEDGYVQLQDCAKYKLDRTKLFQRVR